MDKIITDVRDVTKPPQPCQLNNVPIDPRLDRYIFGGTKCTMDERLCRALRMQIEKTVGFSTVSAIILKILGILTLLSMIVPLIVMIVEIVWHDSLSALDAAAFVVIITAFGTLLLWLSAVQERQHRDYIKAAEKVVPQCGECYKFKRKEIMRYSYESVDSTEYKYYIDLGDFCAELITPSEKWGRAEYVYASVLVINGRPIFMLFCDAE